MENDFWMEKWQKNEVGFHQENVNSRLKRYWEEGNVNNGTVFVPLCGKSKDMLWLVEQGHHVVGVEVSEIPCRDFFEENKLDYEESTEGDFKRFKGESIELLQGDFFNLTSGILGSVDIVYDRAALVALPPDMRQRYAAHFSSLLASDRSILLISMEYDQARMKGPPFSVTEKEVGSLFNEGFEITVAYESSGPGIVGNLANRGLDTLTEKVFVLTKK